MREKRNSLNGFLIFLIYGIFALFSLFLVVIGIGVYNGVVETGHQNTEIRASVLYVTNKVRMSPGGVSVEERDGYRLISLSGADETEDYETLIYYYGGMLMEYFGEKGQSFVPENGEKITELSDFAVTETDGVMNITAVGRDGREQSVSLGRALLK